jgi:hypothetical protein
VTKRVRRLKNLVIDRVDLVGDPANAGARVVLYKRAVRKDEHPAPTFDEALLGRRMSEIQTVLFDMVGALSDTIFGVLQSDDDDKVAAIKSAVGRFGDRLGGELEELFASVEKVGRKISTDRLARLRAAMKALAGIITEAEEGSSMDKTKSARPDVATLDSAARAYIEGLEQQVIDLTKQATPQGSKPEDLLKGLDPGARAVVEKAQADAKAASEKTAQLEADIAKRDEQASTERWIGKAAGLRHLTVKADDLGPALRKIHDTDAEVGELVFKALVTADAAVSKAREVLTREIGHPGAGDVGADDPMETLNQLARDRVEKSGGAVKFEQAFAEVKKTPRGRELYDEYKSRRPKGA